MLEQAACVTGKGMSPFDAKASWGHTLLEQAACVTGKGMSLPDGGMEVTDVTGFELDRAIELLKSEGAREIVVKLARAPRSTLEKYNSKSRVVRQRVLSNAGCELVVCNFGP